MKVILMEEEEEILTDEDLEKITLKRKQISEDIIQEAKEMKKRLKELERRK